MNFRFCKFCDFFNFSAFGDAPGWIFSFSNLQDFSMTSTSWLRWTLFIFLSRSVVLQDCHSRICVGIRFRLAIFLSSISFYERFTSQRGPTNWNCQNHIVRCVQSTYIEHGTNATVPTWMNEYSFPFWNLQDSATVSNWSFVEVFFRFLSFLFKIDVVVVVIVIVIDFQFFVLWCLRKIHSLGRLRRRRGRTNAKFQYLHSTRDKTDLHEKNEYHVAHDSKFQYVQRETKPTITKRMNTTTRTSWIENK